MINRILPLLLALIITTGAFSQDVRDYRPKEHEAIARAAAVQNGIENPILIGVGTITGAVEGLPVKLSYSPTTGLASIWTYYYKDANDENMKSAIALVNVIVNFIPYPLTAEQIASLPPIPTTEISGDWMNTDVFAENLMKNPVASEFFTIASSKINIEYVALGANETNNNLQIGSPYWLIKANSEENSGANLTCFTHAISGETFCDVINSVKEISIRDNLFAYPNPASEFITIPLEEINSFSKIYAFNQLGEKFDFSAQNLSGNEVTLNISELIPASYMIAVETDKQIFIYPVIIQR